MKQWYREGLTLLLPAVTVWMLLAVQSCDTNTAGEGGGLPSVTNHTLTFNANTGTGIMNNMIIAEGSSARLAINTFSREDYTFRGWSVTPTGPVLYTDGAVFSMGDNDIDLYARWIHNSLGPLTHCEFVSMEALTGQPLIIIDGKQYLPAYDGSVYNQVFGSNDSFIHNITPFTIGKYEVTYELWFTVRSWAIANGYTFTYKGQEGNDGVDGAVPTTDARLEPVTDVSWRDVIVWCNAYSELDGLIPCYYTDNTRTTVLRGTSNNTMISVANGDLDNDCVNWEADGYRLPTEGEWQYAARCAAIYPYNHVSGADTVYDATVGGSDLDGDGDVDYSGDVAWYGLNSGSKTHAAGTKNGNRYGIYDMSGNVGEWCWDWYCGTLTLEERNDFAGMTSGSTRIRYGGGYSNDPEQLQVSFRNYHSPNNGNNSIGFRPARRP